MEFTLESPFQPAGDQPKAIEDLVAGLKAKFQHQVLLGVTGSGKTFTMANVIEKLQRPTLIISHNKTLAAQLYQEFRDFFPKNAVSYFVSYYDYYQPESYLPQTDTYIEKETEINEEIDKLRLAATTNLLTRKDTIIVASVSCIYNIGSPKEYGHFILELKPGTVLDRKFLFSRLVDMQYERSDYGFHRGTFRVRGETIDLFPAYEDTALRLEYEGEVLRRITRLDPTSGEIIEEIKGTVIYPAKHYMTDPRTYKAVFSQIRTDLAKQLASFKERGKILEAHRLEKRVNFDLEMIEEIGFVNGIENYSRYFDGRRPGEPPYSLLDYYKEPYQNDWLLFIDESHMTIPQVRGMYNGDRSRKQTLVDYGFRLPSALDNRPLTFDEFMRRIPQTVYVSATPSEWEISMARENAGDEGRVVSSRGKGIIEQIVRPTGLIDPQISVRPIAGQISDLVHEILIRKKRGERVLVTTLTKRMAEDLSEYLSNVQTIEKLLDIGGESSEMSNPSTKLKEGRKQKEEISQLLSSTSHLLPQYVPQVVYLHSDIETLKRSDILDSLRLGKYDVVIGINLLREGLDLPEVSLVAILDADKEGFLRSDVSLVQTMGRAARHLHGQVIMYADTMTGSMKRAIDEVTRRRQIQLSYNTKHGISPQSIQKPIRKKLVETVEDNKRSTYQDFQEKTKHVDLEQLLPEDRKKYISQLEQMMKQVAQDLNFELAVEIRDKIRAMKSIV